MAKELNENLCWQQLQLFVERNLQSDVRYAESFTRTCLIKGKGPNIIRQQLKQHNIEGNTITDCLKNEEYDWFEAAAKVREKKYGEALPLQFADKQKQMRFLQYRGFEQSQIKEAFESDDY